MKKTLLKSALLGVSLLSMATAANAGIVELNLTGASAQYKFWNAAGPFFVVSQGCSAANDVYIASAKLGGEEHGITVCAGNVPTGTAGDTGAGYNAAGDTLVFRYTSFASYEGPRSVQCANPENLLQVPTQKDNVSITTWDCATQGYNSTYCFPACNANGCERHLASKSGSNLKRLAVNMTTKTTATHAANTGTGVVGDLECGDIHIGASDVDAATFNQYSKGRIYGPRQTVDGSNVIVERDIKNVTVPASYKVYRPIVVPFSFFVNDGSPDGNAANDVPVAFNNLSRIQAVALYSGHIGNWNQFDPAHASLPVKVCLRHAGSGTAASLDAAVMRGEGSLVRFEKTQNMDFVNDPNLELWDPLAGITTPTVWFNNGSSDEMNCVGGKYDGTSAQFTDIYTGATYDPSGAIGYADSDKQSGVTGARLSSKYGQLRRINYQGYEGNAANLKYGNYMFWAAQWLWMSNTDYANTTYKNLYDGLNTYASNSANWPAGVSSWWAAQGDMLVEKASDYSFPTRK
ncbi:MAG: hypothetical protein AB1568_05050 [Thermodesulfobacteriota bacterium]